MPQTPGNFSAKAPRGRPASRQTWFADVVQVSATRRAVRRRKFPGRRNKRRFSAHIFPRNWQRRRRGSCGKLNGSQTWLAKIFQKNLCLHAFAVKNSVLIDTDEKLAAFLPQLRAAKWLALDTEADKLHAYPEKNCLI